MTDEQAKENLITAFIPLAEAIHALATSNQTAVLVEISALKDEIVLLTQRLTSLEQAPETPTPEEPTAPEEPIPEDPTPEDPTPVDPEEPPVEAPKDVLSTPYAITSGEWVNGVSTIVPRFISADTEMLRKAFVVGSKVRFGDGDVRDITKSTVQYNKIFVELSGSKLNPAIHGHGKMFIVNPTTEYVPPSEPETPVEPETPSEPETPVEPEVPVGDAVLPMRGANFSGMGNNQWFNPFTKPSQLGTHYRTTAVKGNQADHFALYAAHMPEGGLFLNRQNYALERIADVRDDEPVLIESYAAELEEMVNAAGAVGGYTFLDQHNYCRLYQPTEFNADGTLKWPNLKRTTATVNGVSVDAQWFPIDHPGCWLTYEKWAKVYKLIAQRFKDNPFVLGYGLSNEPHNASGGKDDGVNVDETWIDKVPLLQAAVRSVDVDKWVLVGGCAFSTAKNWRSESDRLRYTLDMTDPKLMFEAHQYPDINGNGGGRWGKGTLHSIDPVARVKDWDNARLWCQEVGKPLYAGEYGGPVQFEKWTKDDNGVFEYNYTVQGAAEYFEQLYAYFQQHGIPSSQWLAGPGDSDNYANGMDKGDGTLKPNANALLSCIGEKAVNYTAPRA